MPTMGFNVYDRRRGLCIWADCGQKYTDSDKKSVVTKRVKFVFRNYNIYVVNQTWDFKFPFCEEDLSEILHTMCDRKVTRIFNFFKKYLFNLQCLLHSLQNSFPLILCTFATHRCFQFEKHCWIAFLCIVLSSLYDFAFISPLHHYHGLHLLLNLWSRFKKYKRHM